MKQLTDYLDRAVALEALAADEHDAAFKAQLLEQAAAYRKIAATRAKAVRLAAAKPSGAALGLPMGGQLFAQ